MKEKTELLTNFKWILKMLIPMVEMLQEEIQSLCNIFSLKIVKIEPANKVQSFFSERDACNARKTSLFISFTSLIGME
jgi:flagellar biosynthesis protein FlhB